MADLLDMGVADPRRPQKRIATTAGGREVWVEISGDDRLAEIKRLPHRWPDIIMARERGESLEAIRDKLRVRVPINQHCQGECDPPCFKDLVADCYAILETNLHETARRRGWLMV